MTNPCEDCRRNCTEPCWKVDHGLLVEPPRWIPVTDHKPEEDANVKFLKSGNLHFTTVLAYGKVKGVRMVNRLYVAKCGIAWLDEYATDGWVWSNGNEDVTHWMHLPEPPKEDDHEPNKMP